MIWLFGAGVMAKDYVGVLDGLKKDYLVIGRGVRSAKDFEQETGHSVVVGGASEFLKNNKSIAEFAIVAVNVECLAETAIALMHHGVKRILLEKPGGVDEKQLLEVKKVAEEVNADVLIAYNRRFYKSVLDAEEIIDEDGGVQSYNFEFTEWSHVIKEFDFNKETLENWFLGNSTHVVDMAFFLGGHPKEMKSYTAGSLDWHSRAAVFSGAGISEIGSLFSYHANWGAPGRWSVEILTGKHRLIFRPMEKLAIQDIGSVAINPVDGDYSLDEKYKPGLYLQVQCFLAGDDERFCRIENQCNTMKWYNSISSY